MLPSTEKIVRASLEADPTITPEVIRATIRTAKGKATSCESTPPIDRIMRACEVAKYVGMTTRSVRRLGRLGAFRRIFSPGSIRKPIGYSEQSVRDFIAGKSQPNGNAKA